MKPINGNLKGILLAIVGIIGFIILMYPSDIHWHYGYRDILGIELPNGVKLVDEDMVSGAFNTRYFYFLNIQGEQKALMHCIDMLKLEKINIHDEDGSFSQMIRGKPRVSGGVNNNAKSEFFRLQLTNENPEDDLSTICEMTDTNLYIMQVGSIKLMRERTSTKGTIQRFWERLCRLVDSV